MLCKITSPVAVYRDQFTAQVFCHNPQRQVKNIFDKNFLSLEESIGKPRLYIKEILPQIAAELAFITDSSKAFFLILTFYCFQEAVYIRIDSKLAEYVGS